MYKKSKNNFLLKYWLRIYKKAIKYVFCNLLFFVLFEAVLVVFLQNISNTTLTICLRVLRTKAIYWVDTYKISQRHSEDPCKCKSKGKCRCKG